MTKFYINLVCLITLSLVNINTTYCQQLAFPGAEGFGRFTTGGRGGVVYEVTNLNDAGEGSLRFGIEMEGARTIVFRLSGTILLESELRIRNGNLSIAGQTAPGDGIALKGSGVVLDADNVIIRYIRFRPGDISGGEPDAIWGRNHKDIIIDHCTMSWAVDEASSFYDNENFTMQWCLLSESLYESQHEKGRHGYGGIWGGQGATFHHNILAHHSSRNPRFNGSRYSGEPDLEIVDYRNNVIYNWGNNSAYGGEDGNHNMVANYYKSGPATVNDKKDRILDASSVNASDPNLGRWHVEGNYVDGFPDITADNWAGGVQGLNAIQLEEVRYEEPFPFAPVETQSAEEAYLLVLEKAGAILPKRDAVDTRIVQEIETGTVTYGGAYGEMKGIIDTQEQVGGWPELFSAPALEDSDHDGIPDDWEIASGLNPEDAEDGKLISDNGYSSLENYLNSIDGTEYENYLKHPSDISLVMSTSSSISLSWVDNEDSETSVILERSTDNITFELVEILEANTISYINEGLESGTDYYYRIKVANETDTSAYSASFLVTTEAKAVSPNEEGLVGHYTFNASSGILVDDESTFENHGEIVDTDNYSWVSGKFGNAINLRESEASGHVLVPHADQIAFEDGSFTVSFWMKATELSSQTYLFHKGSFDGAWYGLELKDGQIRFAVDDDVVKSEVAFDNADFLNNEWVHVVVVRNRENETLNIYKDGQLIQSASDLTVNGIAQDLPLVIANSHNLDIAYNGLMDELRLYNYPLNASEIAGLDSGIPQKASDPTPENNAAAVAPAETVLMWKGDAVAYDLYMGTSADNLTIEAESLEQNSYVTELTEGTTYFWKVDALGEEDVISPGVVWSFKTGSITSVITKDLEKNFNYFPNPSSGKLNIEFHLEKSEKVEFYIYNLQNQMINKRVNSMAAGFKTLQFELKNGENGELPAGTYFVILKTSKDTVVRKIIKK